MIATTPVRTRQTHAALPGLWIVSAIAVALWSYRDTYFDIVETWTGSATFSHGYLIPALAVALLAYNARRTGPFELRPSFRALAALVALGGAWHIGRLSGVSAAAQIAAVAMLPAIVWAILGNDFAKRNLFPLCFVLFAVPLGEGLVPPLMDFTAAFVVRALQIFDIPVFRDGLFFSIPSGNFEVARACSGVRYLIATVALGSLFAYLTFSSWQRRFWFMLACIAVPILANGLRALGIVLIAHVSNLRLAVGVDHFIYGWVFFCAVIGFLFFFGARYSDRQINETEVAPVTTAIAGNHLHSAASALLVLLVIASAPWASSALAPDAARQVRFSGMPPAQSDWVIAPAASDWSPDFNGPDDELRLAYRMSVRAVDLYAAVYARPGGDRGELISQANEVYRAPWVMVDRRPRSIPIGNGDRLTVIETTIRQPGDSRPRLVWHWYDIDGNRTHRSSWAKTIEAWRVLRGRDGRATVIAVSSFSSSDRAVAEDSLTTFVADHIVPLTDWIGDDS